MNEKKKEFLLQIGMRNSFVPLFSFHSFVHSSFSHGHLQSSHMSAKPVIRATWNYLLLNASMNEKGAKEQMSFSYVCSLFIHSLLFLSWSFAVFPHKLQESELPGIIYCLMAYSSSHKPRGAFLYLSIFIPFVLLCAVPESGCVCCVQDKSTTNR